MHFWTRLGGFLSVLLSLVMVSVIPARAQDQQVVTPAPLTQSAAAGAAVSIDVIYDTNPSGIATSGLGMRLFFNSQQLTFEGVTDVLQTNLLGVDTEPSSDTADEDGDPATDMFITGAWAVIVPPLWPPAFPSTLFQVNFTTAATFSTSTTVNIRITDNALDPVSQNATITFATGPQPPVAADDSATVREDGSVTVAVLENDTDPEGDTLTITRVTQGASGTVTFDNTSVTYTPNENFSGTDTFTYTVSDGNGGTDRGTVTVTVSPRNDPPTPADDAAEALEETATPIAVLANDADLDNDPLTVTAVTQGANGAVTFDNTSVTYTSNRNFVGTDTFTYTVSDGTAEATATVNVTVTQVNDNPTARDDTATTSRNRASAPIAVLANDRDVDGDTLQVASVTSGTSGTTSTDGTTVTYTPNTDFVGPDTFTYTVSDGNGGTDTATVTVTVLPNNAPVAVDDSATTAEDTQVSISVLANDTDEDGNTLSIDSATNGTSGTTAVNGTAVQYTPNENFNGTDTFTYTVSDGQGGTATGTVTVEVTAVNDPPVVPDGAITVTAGQNTTLNALAQATDVDQGDTLSVQSFTQGTRGTVTDRGNGRLRYAANRGPAGTDTFTYTVSDGNGGTDTATVNVTITAAPNTDPVAVNDTAMTSEEVAVTINVLANDTDADTGNELSVASVTQPDNGTAAIEDNAVVYTPNAAFLGEDTFTYTVSDGNGGTAEATVTVTVVEGPRITSPVANAIVAGSSVAIASLDDGVVAETTAVLFQFRRAGDTEFTDIGTAQAPEFFIVAWDTTAVADGNYELQAIATVDNNQVRSTLHPLRVSNERPGRADIVENPTTRTQRVVAADMTQVVTSTGVVIDIPAGALAADDRITITQENEGEGLLPGDPAGLFFDISFESGQTEFPENNPLNISIPYPDANNDGVVDETNIAETNLTLWLFDEAAGLWEQVVDATVNPQANVLTGTVTHLTPFSVFQAAEEAENPLAVALAANSPTGTITVDLPVTNREVARLRLDVDSENINIERVRVLLNDQSGEDTIFNTMTVRLVDTADNSVVAMRTLNRPVTEAILEPNPDFVLAAGSTVTLSVQVSIAAATQQGSLGGPQSPATQFAWFLLITPALGVVFFPGLRRNSTRFWIGLLVVGMFCGMMLTACPSDDDDARTFTFTTVIPAGAVTGQAALSGDFAAPPAALTGVTLVVQE